MAKKFTITYTVESIKYNAVVYARTKNIAVEQFKVWNTRAQNISVK